MCIRDSFRQDLPVVSQVLLVNVAIHGISHCRGRARERAFNHRQGGDMANMRVGDPDVLIKIAQALE